jgi:hypothetical protein
MTLIIKKTSPSPEFLYRYTSLPILLDLLVEQRITLLSPETWEDWNDAYYLERYREEMHFRTLLAVCFSTHHETFHYWRVFSNGSSGVCIEFDGPTLLKHFSGKGFRRGEVKYCLIKELQKEKPELETWPFLKRRPFEDEHEYRIIYETKTDSLSSKSVSINVSSIKQITLSPWLPRKAAHSVIAVVKSIEGCENLDVIRSSLINNADWRAAID